jgi:hypothetical protein
MIFGRLFHRRCHDLDLAREIAAHFNICMNVSFRRRASENAAGYYFSKVGLNQ